MTRQTPFLQLGDSGAAVAVTSAVFFAASSLVTISGACDCSLNIEFPFIVFISNALRKDPVHGENDRVSGRTGRLGKLLRATWNHHRISDFDVLPAYFYPFLWLDAHQSPALMLIIVVVDAYRGVPVDHVPTVESSLKSSGTGAVVS